MENLAIYLNCNCSVYADLTTEKMLEKLNNGIASQKKLPEGYTYSKYFFIFIIYIK